MIGLYDTVFLVCAAQEWSHSSQQFLALLAVQKPEVSLDLLHATATCYMPLQHVTCHCNMSHATATAISTDTVCILCAAQVSGVRAVVVFGLYGSATANCIYRCMTHSLWLSVEISGIMNDTTSFECAAQVSGVIAVVVFGLCCSATVK